MIDTHIQLTKPHRDGRRAFSVVGFAEKENQKRRGWVHPMTVEEFDRSHLALDVIFSIAVLGVVSPDSRGRIVQAASTNLRVGGYFILIVPRNDSSILKRCTKANACLDGHVFVRRGIVTFYRNFSHTAQLEQLCMRAGLEFVADLSRFRQVCMLWRRSPRSG